MASRYISVKACFFFSALSCQMGFTFTSSLAEKGTILNYRQIILLTIAYWLQTLDFWRIFQCIMLTLTFLWLAVYLPAGSLGLASPPRTGIFPCKKSASSKGTGSSGLSPSFSAWSSAISKTHWLLLRLLNVLGYVQWIPTALRTHQRRRYTVIEHTESEYLLFA